MHPKTVPFGFREKIFGLIRKTRGSTLLLLLILNRNSSNCNTLSLTFSFSHTQTHTLDGNISAKGNQLNRNPAVGVRLAFSINVLIIVQL